MTDFFISYNVADSTWAEWIAWQLEEAGYTTILQAWDFRPAQNFVIKMHEAIRASERMIAVLSPDYLNASFSSAEWASAFVQDPKGEKGILLPVRVRECDLRGLFEGIIHVDLVGKDEAEAKQRLLAGVQSGRAKPPTKPDYPKTNERLITEHPSFPGPKSRKFPTKSVRALLILLVILIAGLTAFWPRIRRWREPPLTCPKSTSGDVRYYEAEDAELWGVATRDSEHFGFSGDGFVSGYGAETDAHTTFLVDVPADGPYQVGLCYANATKSAKMLSIYVNEALVRQTRLPNASRWIDWLVQSETFPLKAGRNKISYRKTPSDSGQVNLDFIGIRQELVIPITPQPTPSSPMPTPIGAIPTPSVTMIPSPSPDVSPAQRSLEPTDTEMKEALLREMEKFGFQREGENSVVINNPIAGMTIRIERFLKVGCKPASYGVGYECTYTSKLSYSFHSNDGTAAGRAQMEFWKRLFESSLGESATTKKFVKGSEGWITFQDQPVNR